MLSTGCTTTLAYAPVGSVETEFIRLEYLLRFDILRIAGFTILSLAIELLLET